jgi:hypothetical protein
VLQRVHDFLPVAQDLLRIMFEVAPIVAEIPIKNLQQIVKVDLESMRDATKDYEEMLKTKAPVSSLLIHLSLRTAYRQSPL